MEEGARLRLININNALHTHFMNARENEDEYSCCNPNNEDMIKFGKKMIDLLRSQIRVLELYYPEEKVSLDDVANCIRKERNHKFNV